MEYSSKILNSNSNENFKELQRILLNYIYQECKTEVYDKYVTSGIQPEIYEQQIR